MDKKRTKDQTICLVASVIEYYDEELKKKQWHLPEKIILKAAFKNNKQQAPQMSSSSAVELFHISQKALRKEKSLFVSQGNFPTGVDEGFLVFKKKRASYYNQGILEFSSNAVI